MMQRLLLLLFLFSSLCFAAKPRLVNMSWPPVQGAESYEFRLIKVIDGDDKTVAVDKLDSSNWSKEVTPGEYKFQIRSLDYRGVPGAWSEAQSFVVSLPTVKQSSPILNQSFVQKSADSETSVQFSWEEIQEAQRYHFIMKNDAGEIIQEDTLEESTISFEIENPGKYWWKVTALTKKDKDPDPKKIKWERYFKVLSPPLEAPQAHFKVTKTHVLIKWEEDAKAVKDKVQIFRRVQGKWKKIIQKTLKESNTIGFKKDTIKKGKYKLRLVAYTKDNQPSEPAIVYFNWDADTITDIEEEKKKVPLAEDEWSKSPYFVGAGFSLLSLEYRSVSTIGNDEVEVVDRLTGNGFYFTIDYFFNEKQYLETDITFLNVVTNSVDWNFMDLDVFYNWKFAKGQQTTYTLFGGVFRNQEPLVLVTGVSPTTYERTEFATTGLSFGGKYFYQITDHWDVGAIMRVHLNMMFQGLPDGIELDPSLSLFPSVTSEYALTKSIKVGTMLNIVYEGFSSTNDDYIEMTGTSLEFFLTLDI